MGRFVQRALFARIAPAFARKALEGVGARHLHQLFRVAALGHIQLHLCALCLRQKALQMLRARGRLVHGDAFGDELGVLQIIAGQKFVAQGGNVLRVVKQKFPLIGQAPLAETQNSRAHGVGRARKGNDVLLCHFAAHYFLPAAYLFNGGKLVPYQGRALKIQPPGGVLHAGLQRLHNVRLAVAYHVQGAFHGLAVIFVAYFARAHGHALANVRIQTRAPLADVLREAPRAPRQAKHVGRGLHHFAHGKAGGERAVVIGVFIVLLQGGRKARPFFTRDLHIAVALVVLQKNVVFGLVLLDLAAFQHKRFELALRDNDVELERMADHLGHLGVVRHALAKILRNARAQALGLADVDNLALFVADDVHPRQKRQHFCLFPKLLFCHVFASFREDASKTKRRAAPARVPHTAVFAYLSVIR